MSLSRIINLIMILIGGFIAIYARTGTEQNQYVLIAGICILMAGVYRISRNIPSKSEREESKKNTDEF